MPKKTTKIIVIVTLVLILIPAVQGTFSILPEPKLGGYIPTVTNPNLTPKVFFNGDYQQKVEIMLNRSYGLRAWFIRIYNQYQYTFFNKLHADGTIIGKNNCLIGQGYIDAYNGTSFVGANPIETKVAKLKLIQDSLNAIHKDIVFVIASSKGTFFSENIPDYLPPKKDTTNYTYYIKQLAEKQVNYIDFNRLFLQWKDTSRYPLYAKLGVHWSTYGSQLAADSLLHYIENKRGIDLPDMITKKLVISHSKDGDVDIEKSLNLMFKLSDRDYAYPQIEYNKQGKDSLKVLVIGDSFFYAMNSTGMLYHAFYQSDFWFYNNGMFKKDPFTQIELNEFKQKVLGFDYIILLANEGTLHSFGWRFIDDLYQGYQE